MPQRQPRPSCFPRLVHVSLGLRPETRRQAATRRRCRAGGLADLSPSTARAWDEHSGYRVQVGFLLQHGGDGVGGGLGLVQALAREQFPHHNAEGPDVGALVRFFAPRLLGAHVRGCPEDRSRRGRVRVFHGARLRQARFCQTKVEHLHVPVRLDLDVGRLQVAVDDSRLVRRLQRGRDLSRDAQSLVRVERPFRRRALDVLHDQVVRPDVVQRANVGMIQRRDRLGLAREAGAELVSARLDRDGPVEPRVGGAEHLAHPALADGGLDLVRPELRADLDLTIDRPGLFEMFGVFEGHSLNTSSARSDARPSIEPSRFLHRELLATPLRASPGWVTRRRPI